MIRPDGGFAEDVNRVCRYLAQDDFEHKSIQTRNVVEKTGKESFDFIVLFGNQVLATFSEACSLLHAGLGRHLLLSGGYGHSTPFLFTNIARSKRYGRFLREGLIEETSSEARMFAALAEREFQIPSSQLLVEDQSKNTGENARFSLELLASLSPDPLNVLVIQDPLLQRRAMLTLAHAARNSESHPAMFSHAAFVPQLEIEAGGQLRPSCPDGEAAWDADRFLSLISGEIKRLRNDEHGYGPRGRGYIRAEEIPKDVLESHERIVNILEADSAV